MYSIHGWLELRLTPTIEHRDHVAERSVFEWLGRRAALIGGSVDARVVELNNVTFCSVHANFNHGTNPDVKHVAGFVLDVCRLAPGSFGLFHVTDDEDPDLDDQVLTVAVRRGTVEVHRDGYLSPLVPLVEDPYD